MEHMQPPVHLREFFPYIVASTAQVTGTTLTTSTTVTGTGENDIH